MKTLIGIILLLFSATLSLGQNADIKSMIDSLRFIEADTLNCEADVYWRIIAQRNKAIPYLIDKLNDTTKTNVSFHCKEAKLNVGEVSYFALQQIAFFPDSHITNTQFDVFYKNGCWSFFDYIFNNANKKRYQELVGVWYENNKKRFKAKKISKRKQKECQRKFKVNSYLMWKGWHFTYKSV